MYTSTLAYIMIGLSRIHFTAGHRGWYRNIFFNDLESDITSLCSLE